MRHARSRRLRFRLLRQRRALSATNGPAAARCAMNESRNNFLSGPGFAREQNGGIGCRNLSCGQPGTACHSGEDPTMRPTPVLIASSSRGFHRLQPLRPQPSLSRLARSLRELLVRNRQGDVIGNAASQWHLGFLESARASCPELQASCCEPSGRR